MAGRWWAMRPSEIKRLVGRGPSPATLPVRDPDTIALSDLTADDINAAEPFEFGLIEVERTCGTLDVVIGGTAYRLVTARLHLRGQVVGGDTVEVIVNVPGRFLPPMMAMLHNAYHHWAHEHANDDEELGELD